MWVEILIICNENFRAPILRKGGFGTPWAHILAGCVILRGNHCHIVVLLEYRGCCMKLLRIALLVFHLFSQKWPQRNNRTMAHLHGLFKYLIVKADIVFCHMTGGDMRTSLERCLYEEGIHKGGRHCSLLIHTVAQLLRGIRIVLGEI